MSGLSGVVGHSADRRYRGMVCPNTEDSLFAQAIPGIGKRDSAQDVEPSIRLLRLPLLNSHFS